jgi:hypothetical protein
MKNFLFLILLLTPLKMLSQNVIQDNCNEFHYHSIIHECKQLSFPKTVPAGNYSGISYMGNNEYAVVSDKSDKDGFFVFHIDIDSVTGVINNVMNIGFRGKTPICRDSEGIVYQRDSNAIYISGENDNAIIQYTDNGISTDRQFSIPDLFKKNMRNNYGFESLTYNSKTHLFWTINESTLKCDGICSTSTNRKKNRLRLLSFGENMKPLHQYPYFMDEPIANGIARNYAMGVSELLALDDGCLLVLEREFFVPKIKVGAFVNCKLYLVTPNEDAIIDSVFSIATSEKCLSKKLICHWRTSLSLFSNTIANYEGMCLGPKLIDGSNVIVLISDSQNNYAHILKDWFKTIVIR